MEKYWVSVPSWTAQINVQDGVIVKTPPILRQFRNRPFESFLFFVQKAKGFKIERL